MIIGAEQNLAHRDPAEREIADLLVRLAHELDDGTG